MKSPDPGLIRIHIKGSFPSCTFVSFLVNDFRACQKVDPRPDASTEIWSILRTSSNFFVGESAFMASNAVETVPDQVPADDFQALEEKIYRTIEMYKAARSALAAAERDAQRVRQQLEEREQQLDSLRRETVQLRKEREEVRIRVEKMLEQIDALADEQAAS